MHRTLLTGVRADTPIGAMVSFGLLRLNPTFRLGWDDRIAALYTPAPLSADQLVELVVSFHNGPRGRWCRRRPYWRTRRDGNTRI